LMAIIMDVYTEVKADAASFATIWAQLAQIIRDGINIVTGKTVSDSELLRALGDAPEEEVDEEIVMNRVGPGLAREQAAAMISETKRGVDDRLQGSVSMAEAMRMIAWVKIAVQKIEVKLEDLVVAERQEKKAMLLAAQGGDAAQDGTVALVGDGVPGAASDGPAAAILDETAAKINNVESRLGGIEALMQESMGFSATRGKDLRDRMQVIEDLLRSQRDAMVRNGRSIWDQR